MKLFILLISAVLTGPCASASSGDPAPSAAAPNAAATTTPAATAVAAETAPPKGPCALLAQRCGRCPHGAVQSACNLALTAGGLDPSACTNALNDKDIKSECSGGAPIKPPPAAPVAPPATNVVPVAPTPTGPCAELAKKCAKCPAGIIKMACGGAVAAGALDPSACTNALNDKDIQSCN